MSPMLRPSLVINDTGLEARRHRGDSRNIRVRGFFMLAPLLAVQMGSRKARRFRSAVSRSSNPSGLPPRLAS